MITPQRLYPTAALLALLVALLACLASAPEDAAPPAASFATVTPGGRISVSLLTPTSMLGGASGQPGTLIAPAATATAEAATAVAQTATALAPTPTRPGVFTEQEVCPGPGTPTLPDQAPPFNRYAELIARYLSDGGPTTVLEARLRGWNAIVDYGGLVLVDRDFTGDGVPEVLVAVLDSEQAEYPYPGDLFVFGCDEGAYRLLYQAGSVSTRSAPILYSADDLNGDYLNDMVYAVQDCASTVCITQVEIVGWNLTLGSFERLLAGDVRAPLAQVQVVDNNGDGLREVVVTSGVAEVPGAGPQRVVITTLGWDGAQYVVAGTQSEPSAYRIHVIHDADRALVAGDYEGAVDLYRQAIRDETLLSWTYPNELQHLRAYARYRMMLVRAAAGDVGGAQNARDALLEEYALPTPEGGGPSPGTLLPGYQFAEMARIFWQDFALNRSVERACRIVVNYALAAPASYEVLNSFGSANPVYTAYDLCPFGG